VNVLGTIEGYALIWNECSVGMPFVERVQRDSVTMSPRCFFDSHHFENSAFAFARDGSAKVWPDSYGLAFQAELPFTAHGVDVWNGLLQGLRLGVSVSFGDDLRHTLSNGVRDVVAGTVTGISIMRPGHACYRGPGVWLAGAKPESLAPDVRVLRRRFTIARNDAAISAMARTFTKPEAVVTRPVVNVPVFRDWTAGVRKGKHKLSADDNRLLSRAHARYGSIPIMGMPKEYFFAELRRLESRGQVMS
jgi:hypothetical protein